MVANSDVERVPIDIPETFTAEIGYDSYRPPFRLAAFFGLTSVADFTPRRLVAVYWEPAGDECCWDDGSFALCGAEWGPYLDLVGGVPQLGSSETPATHWLIIDRETSIGYVAPVAVARGIVRDQQLPESVAA